MTTHEELVRLARIYADLAKKESLAWLETTRRPTELKTEGDYDVHRSLSLRATVLTGEVEVAKGALLRAARGLVERP